ncbi:MAG: hypothetical protein AAGA65_00280, partial [Actinomycetota bacterium]
GIGATDASKPRDDLFVLLFIGPLVPVLGVAMAYGAEADPAHEISLASAVARNQDRRSAGVAANNRVTVTGMPSRRSSRSSRPGRGASSSMVIARQFRSTLVWSTGHGGWKPEEEKGVVTTAPPEGVSWPA